MIHGALEKPEGYHEHHRQKRRSGDDRPVNVLYVSPQLHDWIEKHPEDAAKMGWTVSQNEKPEDVSIVLPDVVPGAEKPAKKARPRLDGEARKTRKTISLRVPDAAQENGAEVYDTLVAECAKKFAPELGWDEDVPAYFVITAALARALQD